MATVISWCGFLGGWLLFAAPVYQAALELEGEAIRRDEIAEATKTVNPPERVSTYWWLIPPVGYALHRRESRRYRSDFLDALSPEQVHDLVRYLQKARGWAMLAAGALLFALEATWHLWERYEWSEMAYVVVVAVLTVASAGYTSLHMRRGHRVIAAHGSEVLPGSVDV